MVKKDSFFKLAIALLSVLVIIFVVVMFVNKKSDTNESNNFVETAKNLVQKHFNFERIFNHVTLEYDEETGKVTDDTYANYSEFETAVKATYTLEYANSLLTGEDAVYYNKDGNLYVNIDNASHAGVYTGNGDIVIDIKNETDSVVEFEAKVTAYLDNEKQETTEVVYTMIAEKQEDNFWKLKEVRK